MSNIKKIQALSLAKDCYSMKLDLLTNATVVNDAMRFVSEHNNKKEVKKGKKFMMVPYDTRSYLYIFT